MDRGGHPPKADSRQSVGKVQLVMLPLVSMAATLLAYSVAHKTVDDAALQRFEFRQTQVVEAVSRRMRTYESVLRGTLSLFRVKGDVSRNEWITYTSSLQITQSFPGIQAIGYAQRIAPADRDAFERDVRAEGFPDFRITPETPRAEYTSIKYISPMDERNLRAFGYDMWSEATRRAAMSRALDSGKIMLSGRVTLLQETGKDVQPGVLMYLPFYGAGLLQPKTIDARRREAKGFVYAAYRMNDLLRGILDQEMNDVYLTISAVAPDGTEVRLFETQDAHEKSQDQEPTPLIGMQEISMYGQVWRLKFVGLHGFFPTHVVQSPATIVLICGLTITTLLMLLSFAMMTTRKRAELMADSMTRDLDLRARDLALAVTDLNAEITRRKAMEEAQKQLEEKLRHQATTDYLTGLCNRAVFNDALKIQEAHRTLVDVTCGVLLIDLDRFKTVNDSLGHFTGDKILCVVAERLRKVFREPHLLVRQGGDEFAVLLRGEVTLQLATELSEACIEALAENIDVNGKSVKCSCSIGVALHQGNTCDSSRLLSQADMALYQAKAAGRGCYKIFDAELETRMQEKIQLEFALHGAVKNGELELFYQPKIHSQTGAVDGFEGLLRWRHPKLGLVPPDRFIPIAEESTLINEISDIVVEKACAQLALWKAEGRRLPIAVNLSPRQFRQRDLVDRLRAALKRHDVEPQLLEIEITENILITDFAEADEQLGKLRELGLRIAIDDFGTGYSSLAYLHRLDVDVLKIDRSFVSSLDTRHSRSIVESILGLARNLRIEVVAEGVETIDQARFLRAHGCGSMQGYLFSPALPVPQIDEWLAARDLLQPQIAELSIF